MKARVRLQPSPNWSLALAILIAACLWALYVRIGPGGDFFGAYRWMVLEPGKYSGNYGIFSPAWLAPVMAPFVTLPGRAGYALFTAATLIMLLYGARVMNGRAVPLLLSAQVFWVLWWGQIDGLAILGGALCLVAARQGRWRLFFLGMALALIKPQIGLVPAAALWWQSGPDRRKSLAALLLLFLASLLIWGPWPLWVVTNATTMVAGKAFGPWNASLGPVALPLFLPAHWTRLTPDKRLLALTATALLVSPYLPYYSTAILLCFALPWWAYVFAFTGYLPSLIGTQWAWNAVVLLPLSILAWIYAPLLAGGVAALTARLPRPSPKAG
jgi:hypothetical protein